MVFHWSLSDSKSPRVSRTRLRILAVLGNAVVWIVSTRPPKAPITIGIIGTFMFHSFFNSLARSRYLSFFSYYLRFILWSAGTAKSTILQILYFLLIIIRSGLLLLLLIIIIIAFYINTQASISVFNSILTFVGYLMPKPPLYKNISDSK